MTIRRLITSPTFAVAVLALTVGLAAPAAAGQVVHKISGKQLKPNTVTGKQVKESTLSTVPRATTARHLAAPKHHELTLANGWLNDADEAEGPASYTIDAQGYVHLEGAISGVGSSSNQAITLDVAARPKHDMYVPVVQNNFYVGTLYVPVDGEVVIYNAGGAPPDNQTHYTSLDGATWPTK